MGIYIEIDTRVVFKIANMAITHELDIILDFIISNKNDFK